MRCGVPGTTANRAGSLARVGDRAREFRGVRCRGRDRGQVANGGRGKSSCGAFGVSAPPPALRIRLSAKGLARKSSEPFRNFDSMVHSNTLRRTCFGHWPSYRRGTVSLGFPPRQRKFLRLLDRNPITGLRYFVWRCPRFDSHRAPIAASVPSARAGGCRRIARDPSMRVANNPELRGALVSVFQDRLQSTVLVAVGECKRVGVVSS